MAKAIYSSLVFNTSELDFDKKQSIYFKQMSKTLMYMNKRTLKLSWLFNQFVIMAKHFQYNAFVEHMLGSLPK